MELTELQKDIVKEDGNTVVLAAPGSGKTEVISKRIQRVLKDENLKDYQGIIAISFTKKASFSLRDRTLVNGINKKRSYFETIDSFCWSEIISPFGPFIFGASKVDIEVIDLNKQSSTYRQHFKWIEDHIEYSTINATQWDEVKNLFLNGRVILQSYGFVALYILQNCIACRNFIKSRYKQIFIDEFQDADEYTYLIFRKIISLGAVGIAVGDINQSIYGFAHKSSEYIETLTKDKEFAFYKLDKNFRCHPSIINYSNRLLDAQSPLLTADENRMFLFTVKGDEVRVANFLDEFIPRVSKRYGVDEASKVGILVKDADTARVIKSNLKHNSRFVEATPLDNDTNLRSALYADLLRCCLDDNTLFRTIIGHYAEYDNFSRHEKQRLTEYKDIILEYFHDNDSLDIEHIVADSVNIANIVMPTIPESKSKDLLTTVLQSGNYLQSYSPLNSDEVTIMTLHKSKGLEFEVVFHLSLYKWIIPRIDYRSRQYSNYLQDLDLHYVGVTRAKKACIMVVSTQRRFSNGNSGNAEYSEFLHLNNVNQLRKNYTW